MLAPFPRIIINYNVLPAFVIFHLDLEPATKMKNYYKQFPRILQTMQIANLQFDALLIFVVVLAGVISGNVL